MRVINEHLFPLAKFLVDTQTKKLGFTVDRLVVVDEAKADNICGFYDHKTKTIGLNISELSYLRGKYGINDKLRVAAAVVLEECYHAAHHGTNINTEDHACWYGSSQAEKLPHKLLVAQGGQLYKNINNKKEKTKMILKDIPVTIVSGSMFDFANKAKNKNTCQQETKYGTIGIDNNANTSTVYVKTDVTKLDKLKTIMGNVTNASLEYAGMIYVYQNGGWKSYIDIDENHMVEVEIDDTAKVSLTKYEEEDHLEISASTAPF